MPPVDGPNGLGGSVPILLLARPIGLASRDAHHGVRKTMILGFIFVPLVGPKSLPALRCIDTNLSFAVPTVGISTHNRETHGRSAASRIQHANSKVVGAFR